MTEWDKSHIAPGKVRPLTDSAAGRRGHDHCVRHLSRTGEVRRQLLGSRR